MAQTRATLDHKLRTILGTSNVYFDPPESFKLKYPCIVYSFEGNSDRHADNDPYTRLKRYTLIYITKDADDATVDVFDDLRYCRLSRAYTADGMWHYAYEIYI